MERADRSLTAVMEIGRLATSSMAAEQRLPAILEAIVQAFAASTVRLHLAGAGGSLRLHAVWPAGAGGTAEPEGPAGVQDAGLRRCAAEGMPLIGGAAPGGAPTMHVPLSIDGRTAGVLSIARDESPFGAGDLRLLCAVAGMVGASIERSALLERWAAARLRLEALKAIGRVINSSLDPTEVFETFGTETQVLLRHDRLSAHVLAAEGLVEEVFALGDQTLSAYSPGERRPIAASLPARVAMADQPFLAEDLPSDPRIADVPNLMIPRNARSWLSVPLRANGRAFGALNFSTRAPASYGEADIPLAQQIADQLATYLDLVRLHRQERDLAVAEERARLAREIHDTLSQDLSLLVLQLQALERTAGLTPAIQAELHGATVQARHALEAARRSVWDLTPSPLEGRDLLAALEDELDRFQELSGVRGRLTVIGEPRELSRGTEAGLFRITQEALANTRKHGQARRIVLRLRYEAAAVHLTVEDDGRGFDPASHAGGSASGGFGLTSMRERAHLLGGVLEVTSAPGRGTRVAVQLPYAARGAQTGQAPRAPAPDAGAMTQAGIRVVIADDHAVARQGIRRMLEAQHDIVVVGEASDGLAAVEQATQQHPDVVLLDLRMPRMDGTEAIQRLRALPAPPGVIIITAHAQDERVFAALRDGARGYVLKDTSPEELAEAIRAVAGGGSHLQGTVAERLVGRLQRTALLTAREVAVLRLTDEGLRSKEIAIRLVISERTVNFHLHNAYGKLNASSRTEALRIARTRGLLLS